MYLLTGIVLWNYFAEATGNSRHLPGPARGAAAQDALPADGDPASVSLTAHVQPRMNFIAVIVFALANGITPTLSWLELIPIALGFIVLATGIGMLLPALYVRYRDVQPIWEVPLQVLVLRSPIMYTAKAYDGLLTASSTSRCSIRSPCC